jgi:glutamate dehydrogenase/leucine dehydrogenase
MTSLFDPLRERGLTCLRIQYEFRKDLVTLSASREWGHLDWAGYGRAFNMETTLCADGRFLDHEATWALYRETGLEPHLEAVIAMVRAGKHERVECWMHPGRDMSFFNNVHSSVEGLGNGYHCIRSGGIRRHDPAEAELDIVFDGLNLSRGMSFKNVAAGIPFGGCKSVVVCPPVDLDDDDALGFIAYCIDRTRSYTGPDMGLVPELADVMNARYSRNFGGGKKLGVGPSGPPTAYGNYLALKVACQSVFGTPSLAGRTAAVMGLGSVGRAMAEYLLDDGARVLVSDMDEGTVASFLTAHPAATGSAVTVIPAEDMLLAEADIFAPCALGGLFTEENVQRLRYRIIMGSANNTLRASSQEEEIRLAGLMRDRGILYLVEWVQNVGGVMSGIETYLHGEQANMANVQRAIDARVPAMVAEYLDAAERESITPTEAAYRAVERRIYG